MRSHLLILSFMSLAIEVKNNLTSNDGGGWRGGRSWEGTVRRGDYRNYYKGHMDKMKREGGVVEGWGETTHNCN